jgi:S1-C subfamily serine protease
VIDTGGAVIGIASLRLGEPPHMNLAIPIEAFLAAKDELIAAGRVVSRPPRPWLGLYTSSTDAGVVVEDVAPIGPAAGAGFRQGDRIVSVNGVRVGSQEEFYAELWRGRAGDVIRLGVRRDEAVHVIAVSSVDRYRLLRPPAR